MNKRKLVNFIISIPFILAIFFLVMFIRLYINVGSSSEISTIMSLYLIRYRNLAIFCIVIGFILLIIKSIFDYKNNKNIVENNSNILNTISYRNIPDNKTYSLDEDRVVNDLLRGKVLEIKFLDSKLSNRKMKFINYSKLNNSISLIDLEKGKGVLNYDSRYFTECSKCGSIISKDAVKCIHCGKIKKEITKKDNRFNPVIFAVNMIIILLSIIVMILLINKIKLQRDINLNNINVNIKTVETK